MNLIHDPWIPVTRLDGQMLSVSLADCFSDAQSFRDLAVKPHERIALMRLLTCITQAALNGPADEAELQDCITKIQLQVAPYLHRWKDSFELYGDGDRFLQLAGVTGAIEDGTPITKLDLALATGNAPTLFDNAAGTIREHSSARVALNLLTFQAFSPCGRIGVANWAGSTTPGQGSSPHSPCTSSNMLHTIGCGQNLLQTIALNLITNQQICDTYPKGEGRPIWERPIASQNDTTAIENATLTYLGRLVPCTRAIRLHDNKTTMTLAHALDYPLYPSFREASATVVQPDSTKPAAIMFASASELWRKLPAVLVKRRATSDSLAGPLFLQNLVVNEVTLWMGAFLTDKGKPIDIVEASYSVPSNLIAGASRDAFAKAIAFAEQWEETLIAGVRKYTDSLKLANTPSDKAKHFYWTLIDQEIGKLMDIAHNPAQGANMGATPWGQSVQTAVFTTFSAICGNTTPRQLKAFALAHKSIQAQVIH